MEAQTINNSKLSSLEGDLISLSSIAALELDDYITKKTPNFFKALKMLIEKLISSLSNIDLQSNGAKSIINHVDPLTMVVMNRALVSSKLSKQKNTLNEVIVETKEVIIRLNKVIDKPSELTDEELLNMRFFCEELSSKARAYIPSIYMRKNRHPFRK